MKEEIYIFKICLDIFIDCCTSTFIEVIFYLNILISEDLAITLFKDYIFFLSIIIWISDEVNSLLKIVHHLIYLIFILFDIFIRQDGLSCY